MARATEWNVRFRSSAGGLYDPRFGRSSASVNARAICTHTTAPSVATGFGAGQGGAIFGRKLLAECRTTGGAKPSQVKQENLASSRRADHVRSEVACPTRLKRAVGESQLQIGSNA
jgi:xanthine dehydrogenase molybdopterin-binding subunit B